MFANRLRKVHRHIGKWARRQQVTCYRVYDDDIPEFPLAVDIYENILHVAEYARPHGMEPDAHAEWLDGSLRVLSEVLEVAADSIYLKFRQRQQGLQQYERFSRTGAEYIVRENGLKFIINPTDYLDTGLFLDHRNTRQMFRERAAGVRALNLFAYTGAFSVYAAAGGAVETLTIDLSNTYLKWADRNLALNGFTGAKHRLLQADILQWLRAPTSEKWDLIILDPPTFSNSKRMYDILDIQRDHTELINRTLNLLTPDGTLFFSTNHRKFKMDEAALRARSIEEISARTVPEDFRDKRIHRCFLIS